MYVDEKMLKDHFDVLLPYANNGLTNEQWMVILQLISAGIPKEKIDAFAVSRFNTEQLKIIAYGLTEGLSIEEVTIYAKQEYSCFQMLEICLAVQAHFAPQKLAYLLNPELTDEQMREIRLGFLHGLSINEVSTYAHKTLDYKTMEQRRKNLLLALYEDPNR